MTATNIEVHLWCFDLDHTAPPSWLEALSPSELARASRFAFERDARRHRHGRATMRHLLSRWTSTPASQLNLHTGPHGKPSLPADLNCQFNLSHSGGTAILAVSASHEVGLDIEVMRPTSDLQAMARQVMTEAEWQSWNQSPADQRLHGFYCCWTRKEATLKALGVGLNLPLQEVNVGCSPLGATLQMAHAGRVTTLMLRTWSAPNGTMTSLAVAVPGGIPEANFNLTLIEHTFPPDEDAPTMTPHQQTTTGRPA
jgi:4'-phosphopantetheinyl transferase